MAVKILEITVPPLFTLIVTLCGVMLLAALIYGIQYSKKSGLRNGLQLHEFHS